MVTNSVSCQVISHHPVIDYFTKYIIFPIHYYITWESTCSSNKLYFMLLRTFPEFWCSLAEAQQAFRQNRGQETSLYCPHSIRQEHAFQIYYLIICVDPSKNRKMLSRICTGEGYCFHKRGFSYFFFKMWTSKEATWAIYYVYNILDAANQKAFAIFKKNTSYSFL